MWETLVEKPVGQILICAGSRLHCQLTSRTTCWTEWIGGLKLFYSILFYSILFYSILFYSILFYSILFYSKSQHRDVAQSVHVDKEQFNKASLQV